jgi:hypothetical protein
VTGVLDQDLQAGIKALHPDDRLGRIVEDRATFLLLDTPYVNDLESQIAAIINDAVPKELVSLKSSVDILGSFGTGDIHLDSEQRSRGMHEIDFARRYSARNFLKNPPFADCDCRARFPSLHGRLMPSTSR